MKELTHFNRGNRVQMIGVSTKDQTMRTATAQAVIRMNEETFALVCTGRIKKGDVFAVAQVAGIMAAKKNPDLIPLCHPLQITGADIIFSPDEASSTIRIEATVCCKGETGVEMEALTAAVIAALAMYDMCKAVQKDIEIGEVCLLSKTGGKSGDYARSAVDEK
jgi:cyclic pyranopterin phosphate synthase